MKRFTSLAAAAIVAAVGLSPAWGQDVQGEDYTSYLANPSFTEGASTLPGDTISSTAGRGYIMAPKGWRMTYMTTTWDRQFLTYSDYTSATGLDGFQTPLLEPQDADNGFYFHAITGGGSAPLRNRAGGQRRSAVGSKTVSPSTQIDCARISRGQ